MSARRWLISGKESLRSQVRLVILLQVSEDAGLAPLSLLRLHAFAYLSNVLAPVWDMPVFDGKVLKKKGGPFYPSLQYDLDRLVGMGLVDILNLRHILTDQGQWRLDGSYRLNHEFSDPVIEKLLSFEADRQLLRFLRELAYAFSSLDDSEMDVAAGEDATYADPVIDFENVIDFAEWQHRNYTANAARRFEFLAPGGVRPTSAEKIHFYLRHLKTRVNARRSR